MASRVLALSLAAATAAASLGTPALAQKVLLQIKPHVGDTIRMQLTQTIEMTGTRRHASGDSTKTMTTSTEVFSRAVPFQWTSGGTLIHAITDSVISDLRGSASSRAPVARRATPAAPAVLRVATDGSIEIVDGGDASSEIRHIFAEIPSTLPRRAVSVGEKWSKEMRIPLAGDPGAEGTMKATLQLDSLSRSGETAFISIHGTISRFVDRTSRVAPNAYRTSGTVAGSMQIDRALGWITDARSVITVRSEIADAAASTLPLLKIHTRVNVWARAMKVR